MATSPHDRISRQERLLNLVALLLRSRRPVPWDLIRERVHGYDDPDESDATVARRFERDKAALRELGIPVRFHPADPPNPEGYSIPREAVFLPQLRLSPQEVTLLAVGVRFARADVAGPIADSLTSALQKLQFDSPIPGDVRATVEERYLFHRPLEARGQQEQERLGAITDAITHNRTIRFTYYAIGEDRTAQRTVDPYGLGFANGHWYLVGRSHARRAVRSFRIDRIQGEVTLARPDAAGPDFQMPENFRLDDYLGRPPWAFGRVDPIVATVRFDVTVAWMVRQSMSPGDRWSDGEDGGGVLERPVTNPDAMLKWVLGFGTHAEVLGPPDLRRRTIEALTAVRALYAGKLGEAGGRRAL